MRRCRWRARITAGSRSSSPIQAPGARRFTSPARTRCGSKVYRATKARRFCNGCSRSPRTRQSSTSTSGGSATSSCGTISPACTRAPTGRTARAAPSSAAPARASRCIERIPLGLTYPVGHDIVTLHVPLNTTTRQMIGAHELASMKPEAIIVNTSRGPVIDEAALARALADNKLFGAGLDVFDQEPPPPDNPLLALKNVVLTSHFAGPTWDNQIARLRNAYDNVQRVARGEPPLWVVPELSDLVM